MATDACFHSVSVMERFKVHIISFAFGLWMLAKRFVRWLWDPKGLACLQTRDSPPVCLVDNSLGQHRYVKLKGVKFHYVEAGSIDQPLVLLLHGFPDCWLSWRYQIPVLSQDFRVIALDLKGFGDSDKPFWRCNYKVDTILEEIRYFIDILGTKDCILIGHDLGALIGWYLVHQYPNMVTKFIAVSCPHPNIYWDSIVDARKYQWLNFVQLPYLPELDALKEDVKIINLYHKHLPSKDIYLEAYKYSFSRQEDWTGPMNYYRNFSISKINDDSKAITATVVLIIGNRDGLVKLEGVVKSTEYCEKFYMKIIEGGHHFPHQEEPEIFNKIVLKHLTHRRKTENALERSHSKSLIQGLKGVVSNTVKYGNSVIDNVHKKTNGVVSNIPSMKLSLNYLQDN